MAVSRAAERSVIRKVRVWMVDASPRGKTEPRKMGCLAAIRRDKARKNRMRCGSAIVTLEMREASGRAGFQPAVPNILPGTSGVVVHSRSRDASGNPALRILLRVSSFNRPSMSVRPGRIPGPSGKIPALPGGAKRPNSRPRVNRLLRLLRLFPARIGRKNERRTVRFASHC